MVSKKTFNYVTNVVLLNAGDTEAADALRELAVLEEWQDEGHYLLDLSGFMADNYLGLSAERNVLYNALVEAGYLPPGETEILARYYW